MESPVMDNTLVVVGNIPSTHHSVDLRSFFASFVEGDKFALFHYQHRPQAETRGSRCCVVRLRQPEDVPLFWETFHGRNWGGDVRARCILSKPAEDAVVPTTVPTVASTSSLPPSYATQREKRTKAQTKLQQQISAHVAPDAAGAATSPSMVAAMRRRELNPPPGLPKGNVGTSSDTLKENEHMLPPSLLRKLGIGSLIERVQKRRFGYRYDQQPKGNHQQQHWTDNLHTSGGKLKRVNEPLDDDDKRQAAADRSDSESEEEEWDRHERLHPVMDNGRLLDKVDDEPLFEEKCDNPWDKGDASALVMYTDAQYWDANKGGFDERTFDDFDVDTSTDRRDMAQTAAKASAAQLQRRRALDRGREFALRVMNTQGWSTGDGLGKRKHGIKQPLAPPSNAAGIGLGFGHGQDLKKVVGQKEREKKRRRRKVAREEDDRKGFNWESEPRLSDFAAPEQYPIGCVFDKDDTPSDVPAAADNRAKSDVRIGSFGMLQTPE